MYFLLSKENVNEWKHKQDYPNIMHTECWLGFFPDEDDPESDTTVLDQYLIDIFKSISHN